MKMTYKTHGTCSTEIRLDVENGVIQKVEFQNGCNGNLTGISKLVEGMQVEEAIRKMKGIHCKQKPTSCPDQLARALEQIQGRESYPIV